MPKGPYKGGDYEREICKALSMWWTDGERDDVFWRSSQSGGRATQRAKSGKKTFGSYGDVAAVDPIGGPLLEFCTIEIKRGSSHGVPWDLFESSATETIRPFEAALVQAKNSAIQANSMGWMVIARRDRKRAVVYLERVLYRSIALPFESAVYFSIPINSPEGNAATFKFVSVHLDEWFAVVSREKIIGILK